MKNYVFIKFAKINILLQFWQVASWKVPPHPGNETKCKHPQGNKTPSSCVSIFTLQGRIWFILSPYSTQVKGVHPSTDGWVFGTAVFLLISHFLQLFWGDIKAFSSQPRNVISPVCPGSAPEPPPGGTCLEHLTLEAPRRHPSQMPESPQPARFDVDEERLYYELKLLSLSLRLNPDTFGGSSFLLLECMIPSFQSLRVTIGEGRNRSKGKLTASLSHSDLSSSQQTHTASL